MKKCRCRKHVAKLCKTCKNLTTHIYHGWACRCSQNLSNSIICLECNKEGSIHE